AEVETLYAECPIRINIRPERVCGDCGKRTHDLVKGVCRLCYMHRWHRSGPSTITCAQCGKVVAPSRSRSQKFCSHRCYAESLELEWPDWEQIDQQIGTKSIRQV